MKATEVHINITDFSEYPGVRYREQGNASGEEFYFDVLKDNFQKALDHKVKLTVNLDDVAGYATSFLDEGFGNLAYDFTLDEIKKTLKIISNDEPDWIEIIENEIIPTWKQKKDSGAARKELRQL